MPRERHCCDGLCTTAKRGCPAFAPGVIEGPVSRPMWPRLKRVLWALGACWLLAAALVWWAWP